MRSEVIIQFSQIGFHVYPDAPEHVRFLAARHRHTFIIKCGFLVVDLDREKEIFIETERVQNQLRDKYGDPAQFGAMSCEMIASFILKANLDQQMIWCEVWEEETGGAKVSIES